MLDRTAELLRIRAGIPDANRDAQLNRNPKRSYESKRRHPAAGNLSLSGQTSHAKDTIEGIIEWWLLEQRIVNAKREVEKVLQQLVAEKRILRQETPDGNVYYHAKSPNGER